MKFLILSLVVTLVTGFQSFDPQMTLSHEHPNPTRDNWRRFNASELENLVLSLPKSLVYLGESRDGKVIFVDTVAYLSWQDARSHCQSLNLNLLAILSQDQLNLISSAPGVTTGDYWIAARENRLLRSFTWDKLDNVEPAYMSNWGTYDEDSFPYQLCVEFLRRDDVYNGVLTGRPCTDLRKVLCEA